MNHECDPYAPPRPETVAAIPSPGHGWRIENGSLWVCEGAVLPDICIWSGHPERPGCQGQLEIPVSSKFRARRIRVSASQSRYSSFKQLVRICSGGVLGLAAALTNSILIFGDDLPRTRGIISFSLIGLGLLVTAWQGEKAILKITETRDGWYRLAGIPPVVIARLKKFRPSGHPSNS